MITEKDYLKFIQNMSEQEKAIYFTQVKRWTEEEYPRLCAVQEAWTASDFKSFDEGCILISVLQAARAWLPDKIYRKDIERRLTWVRDWLAEINRRYGNVDFSRVPVQQNDEVEERAIYANTPKTARPTQLRSTVKAHADAAQRDGKIPPTETPRPKHLDAYIHLLPVEVQEAAAMLPSLYLKQGQYHQMLHQLADDPRSNPKDREKYAKAVSKTADTITAIYASVEAAWEALPDSEKAKAGIAVTETPKKPDHAATEQTAEPTAEPTVDSTGATSGRAADDDKTDGAESETKPTEEMPGYIPPKPKKAAKKTAKKTTGKSNAKKTEEQ